MRLEKVTAEIRPRGSWESIDLGCALVRENYAKVMGAWVSTVIPVWLLIIAASQFWPWPEGRPWIAGWICLWLLPIFDRVPLFVISRRLFGEDSTWGDLVRALPGMFRRRFFMTLLLGPLAVGRGLAQPVMELEGLRGKAYRERVNLLSRNGGEGANRASFIGLILVLCTLFSLLFVLGGVVGLFGDSIVLEEFWADYVLGSDADFMAIPYAWSCVGLLLVSVTLIEPFYVGAGFAMYINSRTVTEGWDIELAFKRMNERVHAIFRDTAQSFLVPVLVILSAFGGIDSAQASNSRLEQVMGHEDFTVHSETVDVPVERHQSEPNFGFFSAFGVVSQILFWLFLAAAVAGIVWVIVKNSHVFSWRRRSLSVEKKSSVSSIMGMEVAPQSLPENVLSAAQKAWDSGEFQLALSLLYRGALSWMVNQADVAINEGDTELDCVRHVQRSQPSEIQSYFMTLTNLWMALAYGKEEPTVKQMSQLFRAWPFSLNREEEGL